MKVVAWVVVLVALVVGAMGNAAAAEDSSDLDVVIDATSGCIMCYDGLLVTALAEILNRTEDVLRPRLFVYIEHDRQIFRYVTDQQVVAGPGITRVPLFSRIIGPQTPRGNYWLHAYVIRDDGQYALYSLRILVP